MKNSVEIDDYKKEITDSILPLLDDLRNGAIHNIRSSFVIATDREIGAVKSVLKEISYSNPDICGRVDVLDPLEKDTVNKTHEMPVIKGLIWILFLDKYKDKYDHPDIDRLYVDYPQFFTGYFDDMPIYDPPKIDKFDFNSYTNYCKGFLDADYNRELFSLNQYTRHLFEELVKVKEGNTPFMHLVHRESKVLDDPLIKEMVLDNGFITDAITDRVKQEGLKCKTIKLKFDDTDYNRHIFIYKSESEEMNKEMQSLEKEALVGLTK